VDVAAFERLALPTLTPADTDQLLIIDEIGKMELHSEPFRDAITSLFEGESALIATVPAYRHPFTDALKRRRELELVAVTSQNRDGLPGELAERIAPET